MAIQETVEIAIVASSNLDQVSAKAKSALRSLQGDAKATGKAMNEAGKGTKGLGQGLQATEKIAQSAGGRVAELTGRFKSLGEGLALLGGAGGVLVGVTLAAAGVTLALGAMAVAAVSVVAAADEAVVRMKDLGMATKAQVADIQGANDAMAGLGVVMDSMTVTLADELSPAVERISILMVAMGLAAVDAWNNIGGLGGVIDGLKSPVTWLEDSMSSLAVSMGILSEEDAALAKALRSIRDDTDGFDMTMTDLEATLGDYVGKAEAVIGKLGEQRKAKVDLTAATKELQAAEEAYMKIIDQSKMAGLEGLELFQAREDAAVRAAAVESERLTAQLDGLDQFSTAYETTLLQIMALEEQLDLTLRGIWEERAAFIEEQNVARVESWRTNQDLVLAGIEEENAARQKAAEDQAAADEENANRRKAMQDSIVESSMMGIQALIDIGSTITSMFKNAGGAAKAFFIAQKAASIGQVAINTAEAVTKAVAQWGPPPSPAGIAAIASALLVGASSAVQIAAQQPPKFHLGTMNAGASASSMSAPMPSGSGPGELAAILQAGETVRTKEQEAALRNAVPIVLIQSDHRLYEAQARMSLNRGVLREAIQPGASLGQERFNQT